MRAVIVGQNIQKPAPPPEKLRQTWAALAPSKHKTHYVTSPHSAKPRRWPPDTCGMAFEKLILFAERLFYRSVEFSFPNGHSMLRIWPTRQPRRRKYVSG